MMKRFHFRLESVERVRGIREREALGELAKIRSLLAQGQAFRASLARSVEDALSQRERLGIGAKAIATDFQLLNAHLDSLRLRISQADRLLAKMKKEESRCLAAYLVAKRKLSAVEKLHEKARFEHRLASNRQEAKDADDMISMRHRLRKEVA